MLCFAYLIFVLFTNRMSNLYNLRGVSAQKEDVHQAIKHLDKGLFPDAFCKILPDYLHGDEKYACIMHADTAGTKSILAYLYWKETGDLSVWKGIAQDAMVMNIDDMICSGATNGFVLSSTIARNKLRIPAEVLSAVIQGCEDLIHEWKKFGIDIFMAGGETADVGDLVKTIDVGYTAFARLKREDVIRIQPQVGDVIVGFASFGKSSYETEWNSGIGCNGLTSARHDMLQKMYATKYPESYETDLPEEVIYIGKHTLNDIGDNNISVGKMLLSPTRTFAPLVKQILDNYRLSIHGIVHNTGGGQTKCMKYVSEKLRVVKNNLFETPEIFNRIQQASNCSYHEMYQVFNMGNRLDIYTDEATAQSLIAIANSFNIEAQIIGHIEDSDKKELLIQSTHGEYRYT
jgi:phosphoribosylformylglycinamidine cyclo-ligase